MRTLLLLLLILAFAPVTMAQEGSYPTTPGDYIQSIVVGEHEREYLLHIPTDYDGTTEMPLLLAYHGYGDEPANFARGTNFDLLGDEFGVIVAFPAGSGDPVRGWATTAELPDGAADSVAFTEQMIEDISANLAIASDRIYAVGFSNGGGMVHRLACDLPGTFSAIAVVGGVHASNQPCATDIPTPVYAIHGRYERTAPYIGGENLMSIPQWISGWANRNGCTTPVETAKSESLLTVQWRDCEENALVQLVTGEFLQHQWANGMTALIWQFFDELAYSGDGPAEPISYDTGDYEGVVFSHGTVREYRLHLPENFDPAARYPLVISIHGYTSSAFQNRHTTHFSEKADAEGFIVVYPEGRPDDLNNQLGWYARPSPDPAFADDITFINDLINHLSDELPVDLERIYATGLSNGGGMAYRLGCEMSDRIAAIAPVAGAFAAGDPCHSTHPVNVLAIHGLKDNIVEYEGVEGWSESIPQWAADWATRNECDPDNATTTPEDGLTIDVWSGCAEDVDVILYSYAEMRHQWHADATDIIWEFFSDHALSS